jgi:tRNA (guanosine-2'-O-)-methyltransferase
LNISVACAVSVYEAYRQKMLAGHYDQQQLDATTYETLRKEWGFVEESPEGE